MPKRRQYDKRAMEDFAEILRQGEPESAMPPEHPSIFQPDKPVIGGGPEFAREARNFLDVNPRVKRKVPKIVVGPTEGAKRMLERSGLPVDALELSNLLGVTDLDTNDIGINPAQSPEEKITTLIHELTHAAGYLEEETPEKARGLFSWWGKPK